MYRERERETYVHIYIYIERERGRDTSDMILGQRPDVQDVGPAEVAGGVDDLVITITSIL